MRSVSIHYILQHIEHSANTQTYVVLLRVEQKFNLSSSSKTNPDTTNIRKNYKNWKYFVKR